jgi:hypothetical protein
MRWRRWGSPVLLQCLGCAAAALVQGRDEAVALTDLLELLVVHNHLDHSAGILGGCVARTEPKMGLFRVSQLDVSPQRVGPRQCDKTLPPADDLHAALMRLGAARNVPKCEWRRRSKAAIIF